MSGLTTRTALLGALACFAGLVVTGVLAYLIPISQAHDSATLAGFEALNRPRLTPLLDRVAHMADPTPYLWFGLTFAAIAAYRRRWRTSAAIIFLLVATGATTQILKPLLAHPRYSDWLGDGQIAAASWPSGHATASMTLALCAVLAVPARARPTVAAVGAIFAVGVSYSIVALGWHFPSDIIGGFFVAAMWTLLVVAGLLATAGRVPARAVAAFDATGPVRLFFGCLSLLAMVVLARPREAADFAFARPSFLIGASAIAALAALLALGFARALRPSA